MEADSPERSEEPSWGKAAWGLVVALGGAAAWVGKWLAQKAVEEGAGQLVRMTGRTGEALFALAVGLSLLIGGPICMARINHARLRQEKKPKYGLLEKVIVVVGGLVFTAVGTFMLFLNS
jgi:hypothetical protein